jgi:hypothetical protein
VVGTRRLGTDDWYCGEALKRVALRDDERLLEQPVEAARDLAVRARSATRALLTDDVPEPSASRQPSTDVVTLSSAGVALSSEGVAFSSAGVALSSAGVALSSAGVALSSDGVASFSEEG